METDPREVAILKIKELFRHPDDLESKLEIVKKRLQQEQQALEVQLKSTAQSQLDDVSSGLDLLEGVRQQTNILKNRLRGITLLHQPAQDLEDNFTLIADICRLHTNAVKTRKMVKHFRELNERLDEIEDIFDQQREQGTISPTNLLRLHYRLSLLEEFRDNIMLNAQDANDDTLRTLDNYFSRLDQLADYFSDFFWSLVRNIFEFATSDEGSILVSIAKIVEAEERADEKALRLWKNEPGNENKHDDEGPMPKAFKERLFGNISEIVAERFQLWSQDYEDDIFEALEATGFVIDDLLVVFDYVVPRFPKSWKMFNFFTLEYHRQLNTIVTDIASQGDLDAGQILRLLRWVRDYHMDMKKQLGVTEKTLEPRILQDQEQTLIKDYLRLVRSKVDEWMANLTRTVAQEFMEREQQPEMDADGKYGMSVAVIVFQVVNQQVDVATEANRGQLLCDVVEECTGALVTTQQAWSKLMQTEVERLLKGKDVPKGLVDYIIALGNEQLRCVEFCDTLVERLSSMVSNKYAMAVGKSMDDAMSGFLNVANFSLQHNYASNNSQRLNPLHITGKDFDLNAS